MKVCESCPATRAYFRQDDFVVCPYDGSTLREMDASLGLIIQNRELAKIAEVRGKEITPTTKPAESIRTPVYRYSDGTLSVRIPPKELMDFLSSWIVGDNPINIQMGDAHIEMKAHVIASVPAGADGLSSVSLSFSFRTWRE